MMIGAVEQHGTRCRLVRADGSQWKVTGLRHADHGLEVDAVHFEAAWSGGDRLMDAMPCLRRLDAEPLERGDLIQWVGDEGQVLWSMAGPTERALA